MADTRPNNPDHRDEDSAAGWASAGWALALPLLALTVYFARFAPAISSGETFQFHRDWVPTLGVNLTFSLDGLSLLFALLITGIGALVLIYAGGYMAGRPYRGRFFGLLLLFMASMLGLVLADNLLLLYVFWELTSLSSYFLIGFDHKRAEARAAALQALLVTAAGGLALLAGVILLGQAGGSLQLSTLLTQGDQLRSDPLYAPALLLIVVAAFTKSAQFPFHFWLPGAMEAPTPVSAYLHSATMVKAGVYLLARLSPALGGTPLWFGLVAGGGALTMVLAGLLALFQTDLKRILAYSTVSALGLMVLLLGVGTSGAVQGCLVFLLAHALYKGALFMIAGIVDHETGTREVDQLGGLASKMPLTAAAGALAAMSLAGFGPVLSFIGKEMIFETLLAAQSWLLLAAAVLAGGFFATVAALVGLRPFHGQHNPTPRPPHEASLNLLLGPLLLAIAGVAGGLFPDGLAERLIAPAVSAVWGQTEDVHLVLWHGFNLALLLSVVSLVIGIVFYLGWDGLRRNKARLEPLFRIGPARGYELGMQGLSQVAVGTTRLLQSGYLRYYLMITVATTVGLTAYALVGSGMVAMAFDPWDLRLYEAGLAGLILLAILSAVLFETRLAAIAALGVVGYGVAIVFVLFGAPDLAMTQFLVETLTVILFVLVFYHLPESQIVSDTSARWRDALLAATAGALMTVLVLASTAENYAPISSFFEEYSVTLGHGRNVVNVILVDFRALDTLGEITVLSVAAIGVYGLLKLRPRTDVSWTTTPGDLADAPDVNGPSNVPGGETRSTTGAGTSHILRTTTRLLLPLLLLFSLFLLVRGHNEPGGGFSGGLVAASAFVLYRFAFGRQAASKVLPISPLALLGTGLLVAMSSGLLSLLVGNPLMTGLWDEIAAPGFGSLHVGTPLLFDVGVYITVVGVTLLIILPLAEE